MLKFLVFLLLIFLVVTLFALRQTPRRPPRDWGRGGDDGGPILPMDQIGQDSGRKLRNDPSADDRETAGADAGSDGSSGGGDD